MSLQVSSKPEDVIVRRTAEYHPSIWGDRFLSFDTNSMDMDDKTNQQVEELKEQVRRMLTDVHHTPSQKLNLIDYVQRLGISYHFETEIKEALQIIHDKNHDEYWSPDLYTISLKFRLLRQQGYRVSCDVFKKFMDKKGEFKESLASDARGMLGLYEATHLRVHGEDVLEQALAFTTTNLKSCLASELISAPMAAQVSYALKQPLHKGIPRVEHRYYIDIYQQDASNSELLLTFAKLDFNILQNVHLKELSQLTSWWKDLDFKTKLPYARDRMVECYLSVMFVLHEPRYVLGRMMATKVLTVVSYIDDTFDNYGTFEELDCFTKAIQRWDIAALDELPKYMHVLYVAFINVYREIEELMVCDGKSWAVNYVKEAVRSFLQLAIVLVRHKYNWTFNYLRKLLVDLTKALVRAFFEEAKWFNKSYTPTLEEYLSVTPIGPTYQIIAILSSLGMGDLATNDAFDWLLTNPKSFKGSFVVTRLMNDIVSHEFEQKRGHVASSVECYMKQHGVEEQDAIDELNKRVSDAWKDINEECLEPTPVPMPLLTQILNCTRVTDVVYKHHDGFTNPNTLLKGFVTHMFVDCVPI